MKKEIKEKIIEIIEYNSTEDSVDLILELFRQEKEKLRKKIKKNYEKNYKRIKT